MKEKLVVAVCLTLCAVLFASVTVGGLRLGAEADEESAPGDLVQIEIGEGSVLLPALDDGASDEPEAPWTYQEIEMLAKTVWAEARGVKSTAQQAAVVWCVLNRVDAGGYGETIAEVVSAPYQFAYDPASPVTGEFLILAEDVLLRWGAEKAGEEDVGRTLPADYLFFEGDGVANCVLLTDDDVIICDPESEYTALVQRLLGQVIKISPTSTNYINPMDLNLDYSDDESPLSLKSDFILSLCELIVGGKEGLQPVQKTIIDRCVRLVYQPYLNDPRPENMPILEDLYNLLRAQEEKEAQHIATALEIYVTGSLNVFNHRSNVDINSRIVCYDIKDLGKQLKKIGMLIVQDQVWNRVTVNRAAHKATRYYIDEMHLLLKEEQTAAYTVEIWKRFRKWGGIPTGITQNVKDLLASREVENIFENSDFVYMLNQAGGDRQILAKQLGISPSQLSYVTQSGEGEGLLFYGSVIIPFIDHFPKNTELYRIMTTKPQEIKEDIKI